MERFTARSISAGSRSVTTWPIPMAMYQETTSTPFGGELLVVAVLLELRVDLVERLRLVVAEEDGEEDGALVGIGGRLRGRRRGQDHRARGQHEEEKRQRMSHDGLLSRAFRPIECTRPATARTFRGAASQMVTAESRLRAIAIQNASW